MATNYLLPFANGETPNVMPFAEWEQLPARLTGFRSGIASSQQFNYILNQGGSAGYVIGQFVVDHANVDATLKATELYENFKQAVANWIPNAIGDKSIATVKLADYAVTEIKLANGAVSNLKLADNAVGTTNIQNSAVSTDKIATGAVTDTRLAKDSVTTEKVASGAITGEKIASQAVDFSHLLPSAIATQTDAQAVSSTTKLMTPYAVGQSITAKAVTLTTTQTISGTKTFNALTTFNGGARWGSQYLVRTINGQSADSNGAVSIETIPPGTIIAYAGKSVPNGYLLCNGGTILRSQYPSLVPVLGAISAFAGDGSTTLVLPNLHQRFMEFTADGNQVGQYMEAGLPNITGFGGEVLSYQNFPISGAFSNSGAYTGRLTNWAEVAGSAQITYLLFDASVSNSTYGKSSLVQPQSLKLLPLIKF